MPSLQIGEAMPSLKIGEAMQSLQIGEAMPSLQIDISLTNCYGRLILGIIIRRLVCRKRQNLCVLVRYFK
jgi:hypothetical protein